LKQNKGVGLVTKRQLHNFIVKEIANGSKTKAIVKLLNDAGVTTFRGNFWTEKRLNSYRSFHGLTKEAVEKRQKLKPVPKKNNAITKVVKSDVEKTLENLLSDLKFFKHLTLRDLQVIQKQLYRMQYFLMGFSALFIIALIYFANV
jgi:hypothetical protein